MHFIHAIKTSHKDTDSTTVSARDTYTSNDTKTQQSAEERSNKNVK